MSNYGFRYPFYRDPREDERAIGALAGLGRPADGPSPEQASSSFGALARMGLVPDEAPPEPMPDTSAEDSQRANAFAALLRAHQDQQPPEPEPEPGPDPAVEESRRNTAFGAFSRAVPPPEPMAAPPDPEIERRGLASSFGALAQTGRENAPPPPPKPSPVPVGLQDQLPAGGDMPDPQDERSKPGVGELPSADGQDDGPQVNQWALAAALLTDPSGRAVQQVLGLAQQQRAAWEHSRAKNLTPLDQARLEIERGNLEARKAELEHRNAVLQGKFGAPGKTGPGAPPSPDDAVKPEPFNQDEVVTANLGDPPDPSEMGDRVPDFVDPGKGDAGETPAQKLARERFEYQKQRDLKKDTDDGKKKPAEEKTDLLAAPMPFISVNDDDESKTAWKASMLTPGERGKVTTYAQGARSAITALDEMIKIREEHGIELYGENKKAFDAAMARAIAGYTVIGHSGVLNAGEFERYKSLMGGLEPKLTDALDVASDAVDYDGVSEKPAHDTVLEGLKAVRGETLGGFNSGLSIIGARYNPDWAPQKKQPHSEAPPPPASAGNGPSADSFDLGGGVSVRPLKVGKQDPVAPKVPGELGEPVGLDVEVVKDDGDPFTKKWGAKGKLSAPKSLTDDDLYEKYREVMRR